MARADPQTSWLAMPSVGFDTDDGLGFGARVERVRHAEGVEPYRLGLMAQTYFSLKGYQDHELRYDHPGLGAHGRTRLTLFMAWRAWKNDGYWGIGDTTRREAAYVGDFEAEDLRRKRYRYQLFQPFAHLTVQHELAGPWSVYGALEPKYSVVQTYAGSLLAEQQPYGMGGGVAVLVEGGVLRDTREPEIAPRRGTVFELGGRWAPPLDGEAGGFGGPLLSARGYRPLGERVVLAGRLMAEYLAGTVPFYEMVHWSGLRPVRGVGGAETVRGLAFGRYRGPGKAVANAELRVHTAELGFLGRPLAVELSPFIDAATVFGPGDTSLLPHPAAGLGLRGIYDRTFVGRVDAGWGLDPVQEDDGTVRQEATLGLYLVFDHPF